MCPATDHKQTDHTHCITAVLAPTAGRPVPHLPKIHRVEIRFARGENCFTSTRLIWLDGSAEGGEVGTDHRHIGP